MSEFVQTDIRIDAISKTIEQRIAEGEDFDGAAPSLSTLAEPLFVPFWSATDGVFRMKNPGPTDPAGTIAEGDHGGLFTFAHKQPVWITQLLADLGASTAWFLNIILTDGSSIQIATATAQYVVRLFNMRFCINPGEKLKFATTSATKAMWLRVSARLEQAGL